MTPKNRAIGKAARTKAVINGLERIIQEGIDDAQAEGLPVVVDRLMAAQDAVAVAHARLTAVALALSEAFNDTPEAFSGGSTDDKKDPPEDGNP